MQNFHSDLATYIKNQNNEDATKLVLNELAKSLVKDREDFIEVLRSADLSVLDNATDLQLIDGFVKNAPNNKKLLLGASFLVNHKNQTLNFDGESEVSDSGVKNSYKAMDEFFNVGGWADAIKGIADVGGKISGKVMDTQNQKKRGASTQLAAQQQARREMAQSVLAQRQQQAELKSKEKETKAKTTKTLLIVGGSILGLAIIGGIIYAIKKKK